MSKRDARIARKSEALLKHLAKSARLREVVPQGGPRLNSAPSDEKQVRIGADPVSIYSMKMSWACDAPDCDGAWSWGDQRQWGSGDWDDVILPKLAEWSQLTWGEIDKFASGSGHKMHHNMDTSSILDEARLRMMEIERHSDIIFRFRLGNKRRLWGHRVVEKFEILWFDPAHNIYPTEPD